MDGNLANLRRLFRQSDDDDRRDGLTAYFTYREVISEFAEHYGFQFAPALAAFVAMSPNSDYHGNLRSLASLLEGIRRGHPCERITVSTYKHCRDRAYLYATGAAQFLEHARGLKIRAFYMNISDPHDESPVTIDGHMVCAWRGINAPMKGALVRRREYEVVAGAVRRLARQHDMIPNQMQATLWLARKRLMRIRFTAQLDFFLDPIRVRPADAPPYATMEQA